jgi:HD-GYP domain-containing protein (c-di-GMP phosphodiesterase class II)
LAGEGESAELLYELGKINFQLHDASSAIGYYERALALAPESTEIKLAYADANIKRDEYEKIQLKGKLRRVAVYEVTGIKSRLNDETVLPLAMVAKYCPHLAEIEVPGDLVLAVEALDGSVGNSSMTALLSYAIADQMQLNEDFKKVILLGAYVQDIGKEAVPHRVLNRPGSLSEQETKLVEKYVQESVATLKRLGYVDPRLHEIVRHHHEKWDGGGYPEGLKGEEIPIGARITAVAEAYTALTAWRPYREPWDARVALSELHKGVEKGIYDPHVVDLLSDLLRPST